MAVARQFDDIKVTATLSVEINRIANYVCRFEFVQDNGVFTIAGCHCSVNQGNLRGDVNNIVIAITNDGNPRGVNLSEQVEAATIRITIYAVWICLGVGAINSKSYVTGSIDNAPCGQHNRIAALQSHTRSGRFDHHPGVDCEHVCSAIIISSQVYCAHCDDIGDNSERAAGNDIYRTTCVHACSGSSGNATQMQVTMIYYKDVPSNSIGFKIIYRCLNGIRR